MNNSIKMALFLAVIGLGGCASLAKTLGWFSGWMSQVETRVGGDIVMHLTVATLLGIAACWAGLDDKTSLSERPKRLFVSRRQFALLALSLLLVSLDEGLQYFAPTRTFSLSDWLANVCGLTLGVALFQLFNICRLWRVA